MRRADLRPVVLLLLCGLGGCDRAAVPDRAVAADNEAVPAPPPNPLERAAIATGVVADAARISPAGLFARQHEAGRDSLCLIADPDRARHFHFGLETVFGSDEYCRGHGEARRAGDKLVLQFSGRASCIVVADYEGDRIALPGVVDTKCADICAGRSSLEGVAFPRLASDAASARAARDRDGNALCE